MSNLKNKELYIRHLIHKFFDYNLAKTNLWFGTPNPNLGNFSPSAYLQLDKHDKLLAYIESSIKDGKLC